jgi:hypothetical protein
MVVIMVLETIKNTYDPYGIDCQACKSNGGQLKRNGSYVWGLTQVDGKIYWGTNNNLLCQAFGMLLIDDFADPYENPCWVCEASQGINGKTLGNNGDLIRPRVFCYDPTSGHVQDITPLDTCESANCQGFRSAGGYNGVVFIGGPDNTYGSTVFAYSTVDNDFLGFSHFENVTIDPNFKITNIRKWLVVNGALYCGVRYVEGSESGGALLRWTGDKTKPFSFEVVGKAPNELAELTVHNGCIFAGGWPAGKSAAAIYQSQQVPEEGFTKDAPAKFNKVWDFSSYETDRFLLQMTGVGGFKSFNGHLYWGMLYPTWVFPFYVQMAYRTTSDQELINAALGSLRSSPLFCAKDFDNDVELLYGESELPKYDYVNRKWNLEPNATSMVPKWGRSGWGNIFNDYIWAMDEYKGKLYVGTMDWSNLIVPFSQSFDKYKSLSLVLKYMFDQRKYGYDMLAIEDPDKEPTLMTYNGFDNDAAYGIRNLMTYDNTLYVGTANPLSLHEKGGWQLLALNQADPSTDIQSIPVPSNILFKTYSGSVEFASLDGSNIAQVTLYDMSGMEVFSQPYDNVHITVNTSNMDPHVYIAEIKTKCGKTYKIKCHIK